LNHKRVNPQQIVGCRSQLLEELAVVGDQLIR
jgi:hypothetical protein